MSKFVKDLSGETPDFETYLYVKDFISKYGEENTLIVSADIENQINELENNEKKNYMDMIFFKKTIMNVLSKH